MENCEICNRPAYVDKHHIHSKTYGGPNNDSNIARLCKYCHDLVHRGNIILEGRFQTTEGNVLIYHNKGEESVTGCAPKCYIVGTKTPSRKTGLDK